MIDIGWHCYSSGGEHTEYKILGSEVMVLEMNKQGTVCIPAVFESTREWDLRGKA